MLLHVDALARHHVPLGEGFPFGYKLIQDFDVVPEYRLYERPGLTPLRSRSDSVQPTSMESLSTVTGDSPQVSPPETLTRRPRTSTAASACRFVLAPHVRDLADPDAAVKECLGRPVNGSRELHTSDAAGS